MGRQCAPELLPVGGHDVAEEPELRWSREAPPVAVAVPAQTHDGDEGGPSARHVMACWIESARQALR